MPAKDRPRLIRGPPYEAADEPDDVYPDGQTAAKATVAHAGGYLPLTSPVCTEDTALSVRPVEPPHIAPASRLVITEVNQSIWTSQLQVTDLTGGSLVQAYYASGLERRGPLALWDNTGGHDGDPDADRVQHGCRDRPPAPSTSATP